MTSTWTMLMAMALVGAVAIGCEQSGDTGEATSDAGDARQGMGDMLEEAAESGGDAMKSAGGSAGDLGDAATSAMDSVVKPIEEELSVYARRLEAIQSKARIVANAQLDALVGDVMAKYNEIKGKVDLAMTGDAAAIEALKADGTAMMNELKQLFDQAMAKLTELSLQGA